MMKGIFREVPDMEAWGTYQFYCFVLAMLFTLVLQMRFLNLGLKYHDTMIVVPVYQTWWILGGIIGGGTYFKEFDGMSTLNIVLFVSGVLMTIFGVQLLMWCRASDRDQAQPDNELAAKPESALQINPVSRKETKG